MSTTTTYTLNVTRTQDGFTAEIPEFGISRTAPTPEAAIDAAERALALMRMQADLATEHSDTHPQAS
jgi:hypothetical protein